MPNFEMTPEQKEACKNLGDAFREIGFEQVHCLTDTQDEDQRHASLVQHLIFATAQQEEGNTNGNA